MIRKVILLSVLGLLAVQVRAQVTLDICAGDTVVLQVAPPPNSTIQWQQSLDGTNYYNIPGGTGVSLVLTNMVTTRHFRAEITGPECDPYFSEENLVIVHQLPVLNITGLDPSYCITNGAVILSGNPSGGIFSGTGITGNSFNPSIAGVGVHTITYSYTDGFGCSNSLTNSTGVVATPTQANAGPDITATSLTVGMAANTPSSGTGQWFVTSGTGGSFANVNSPLTNFTGTPNSTYTLVWAISNLPCPASSDTLTVTMPAGPSLPSVPCGSPSYTMYVHPTDNAGPMTWGCIGIVAGAGDDNNGTANTSIIVQACGLSTAAGICDTLVAFGYSDWYLPSYNELECVRLNAAAIGGFASAAYWSSTEGTGIFTANARYRTFPTGTSGYGSKSNSNRIRCVRKD